MWHLPAELTADDTQVEGFEYQPGVPGHALDQPLHQVNVGVDRVVITLAYAMLGMEDIDPGVVE